MLEQFEAMRAVTDRHRERLRDRGQPQLKRSIRGSLGTSSSPLRSR